MVPIFHWHLFHSICIFTGNGQKIKTVIPYWLLFQKAPCHDHVHHQHNCYLRHTETISVRESQQPQKLGYWPGVLMHLHVGNCECRAQNLQAHVQCQKWVVPCRIFCMQMGLTHKWLLAIKTTRPVFAPISAVLYCGYCSFKKRLK